MKNLKDSLKILAFSDVHGDQSTLAKLVRQAETENVDLVVIGGDFSSRSAIDMAPPNLVGPFLGIGKEVLAIHGNNETELSVKMLEDVYGIKSLHGYYKIVGDVGIFGCGGAPHIGPFTTKEEEIFTLLSRAHEKIKHTKRKVMVTHAHPSGTVMEQLTTIFPGSDAVRKAIDEFKPDVVVCGHVHEAEGMEEMIGKTKVINVAKSGKVFIV